MANIGKKKRIIEIIPLAVPSFPKETPMQPIAPEPSKKEVPA